MFRTINNYSRRDAAPISEAAMRQLAPSIFAEAAHDSRSERYTYIPTSQVLAGLQREGFQVHAVEQSRTRDEDRRDFTKHLIRLRHASQTVAKVGDSIPEIVLINSHDGTSAYRMFAGMMRLICLNGLMVGAGTIEDVRVPHKGDVSGRVIEGAFRVLDQIPQVQDSMADMGGRVLTAGQQGAFARAALALRYTPEESPIQPEQLLRARRYDDKASDLWTTFNRVQENMIRGGLRGRNADGKRTSTREVRGIDSNVGLNRALWTLADEMRKLAA